MPEITIGSRTFSSKSKAVEFVKGILNSYGPRPGEELDLSGDDFLVMMSVFGMHADFNRKFPRGLDGIERIFVMRDSKYGGRTNQFWYQYDGVKDDISFYRCFESRDSYLRNRAVSAFREAVMPQIQSFKRLHLDDDGTGVCALSGIRFQADDLAVDHMRPFSLLLSEFMLERRPGMSLGTAPVTHVSGEAGHGSRLSDDALEHEWYEWHGSNAVLQLVNKVLNMRLQDYDKSSDYARRTIEAFKSEIEQKQIIHE